MGQVDERGYDGQLLWGGFQGEYTLHSSYLLICHVWDELLSLASRICARLCLAGCAVDSACLP